MFVCKSNWSCYPTSKDWRKETDYTQNMKDTVGLYDRDCEQNLSLPNKFPLY